MVAEEDLPRPYKGPLRIFSFEGDLPRFAAMSFQGTLWDLLFWAYCPGSRIPRQTRDPQIVLLAPLGWSLAKLDISPESEIRPQILQSSICLMNPTGTSSPAEAPSPSEVLTSANAFFFRKTAIPRNQGYLADLTQF